TCTKRELDVQIAERHVHVACLAAEILGGKLLRVGILPRKQQPANLWQRRQRLRIDLVARLTSPKRIFIEGDHFPIAPTPHARPNPAVAHQQRFRPSLGGLGVPELQVGFGNGRSGHTAGTLSDFSAPLVTTWHPDASNAGSYEADLPVPTIEIIDLSGLYV